MQEVEKDCYRIVMVQAQLCSHAQLYLSELVLWLLSQCWEYYFTMAVIWLFGPAVLAILPTEQGNCIWQGWISFCLSLASVTQINCINNQHMLLVMLSLSSQPWELKNVAAQALPAPGDANKQQPKLKPTVVLIVLCRLTECRYHLPGHLRMEQVDLALLRAMT